MNASDNPEKVTRDQVVEVLKKIYDPEIPVDIWELGLIYDIDLSEENQIKIQMTLTSPNCPVAESLPIEVRDKLKALPGIENADVNIVWDPPWNPEMMSEVAKVELGYM